MGIAALFAGAAALLLAASAAAQTVRYEAQPANCKLKMEGTSTIHDWTVESTNVNGFIEADANFPESALKDPAGRQTQPSMCPFQSALSRAMPTRWMQSCRIT